MEYKNFNSGEVQDYVERKSATVGENAKPQRGPEAYAIMGLALIFSLIALSLAASEWGFHDINGECALVEATSDQTKYADTFASLKENHPDECSTVTSVKDCVKKVCGISDVYYGQCVAPKLIIAGGVFGVLAVFVALAEDFSPPGMRTAFTVALALFVLLTFFLSMSGFATSFFRFGSGNWKDADGNWRADFKLDKTVHADCSYTYGDTNSDYKAMTAFAFLSALLSLVLLVFNCLWCNKLRLHEQQVGMSKMTDMEADAARHDNRFM